MPTYDYQCRSCGNTIEVIHSMLEDGPSSCERCGGELRRILHPAGIIFRGSGFYKTDSRSSGSASVSSSPAKAGDGGDAKGADKKASDAKAPTKKGDAGSSAPAGGATSGTD